MKLTLTAFIMAIWITLPCTLPITCQIKKINSKTRNAFFKYPPSILKDLPLPDLLFNWDSFSRAAADHFCFSLVLFQFSIHGKNLRLLLCFSVISTPFQCLLNHILTNLKNEYALLAFKSHISFEPENPLSHNWSTTTYFCNWMGVTCSACYQRVIALNLPNIGLTGTIPPYILSFLVSINFSGNNFSGPLPYEPSHLHRLKSSLICSTAILVDFFQHGLERYLGCDTYFLKTMASQVESHLPSPTSQTLRH